MTGDLSWLAIRVQARLGTRPVEILATPICGWCGWMRPGTNFGTTHAAVAATTEAPAFGKLRMADLSSLACWLRTTIGLFGWIPPATTFGKKYSVVLGTTKRRASRRHLMAASLSPVTRGRHYPVRSTAARTFGPYAWIPLAI